MTPLRLLLPALAVLLTSCSTSLDHAPDVKTIYARSSVSEVRNPVIVIHGILGARLQRRDDGRVVWGAFSGDYLSPEEPEGARALALPFDRSAAGPEGFDPEREPVIATGPVDRISVDFLFFNINVNVYAGILRSLGVGGYRDTVVADYEGPEYGNHFTCYSFFYDWRQDCVANARALGAFIQDKRREIHEKLPGTIAALRARGDAAGQQEADALEAMLREGFRFDVVAHSMGGLVARWYLRHGDQGLDAEGPLPELNWAGSRDIDRLVLVGTPSHGSALALERLCRGFQPAPITPHYDAALLGNMPALYQLLPRARHGALVDADGRTYDPLDPDLWIANDWGMLDPDSDEVLGWLLPEAGAAERRQRAEESLRAGLNRARRFHAALDRRPEPPPSTRIHLFAADTEETVASWPLRRDDLGRLRPDFDAPITSLGDGTVTRASALADESARAAFSPFLVSSVPWSGATFIPDDHVGLTSNPVFTNNVLHLLLEQAPQRFLPFMK